MQRSATTRRTNRWHPRSRGLDLPRQSQEPREDADFCLNPAATPFDPNRPLLGSQSEFIQDFYQWWDFCAFSWEGEDRSTKILTFFVDHRAPHLRYDVGREVHLFEDYHWEDHIKSTWRELIDIGSELEFHLVHPQPPLLRPLHAACVVSVQAPREDLQVSPLITVSEGQGNLDLRGRSAITVPENIYLEQILAKSWVFSTLLWCCTDTSMSSMVRHCHAFSKQSYSWT